MRCAGLLALATLTAHAQTAETIQVQLLDALGRPALSAPAVAAHAGTTHISLGAAAVAPGAYVLRVITRSGALTQRVTVVR